MDQQKKMQDHRSETDFLEIQVTCIACKSQKIIPLRREIMDVLQVLEPVLKTAGCRTVYTEKTEPAKYQDQNEAAILIQGEPLVQNGRLSLKEHIAKRLLQLVFDPVEEEPKHFKKDR
ncbi:MAG: hypothetical protein PHI61_06360 [Eubacteriales bacterium]|jgi:hypothetical protein|nr:hypothetical protein [Eubacteriales bacterium]NLV69269.1 hypothetical protein [Clostridiales bacterium]HPF18703.1 hypothetical protein [Bacillota bacterium]